MSPQQKYEAALENIPPSGGGGCHAALLGVANHGVHAGLEDQQILDDLRAHIYGDRVVPDSEIIAAIKKARGDHNGGVFRPSPKPRTVTGPRYMEKLLRRGAGTTIADLLAASPITIPTDPLAQTELLLKSLYRRHEYLFAGTTYRAAVLPAGDLLEQIKSYAGIGFPHFIPNPMTGQQGLTKTGRLSYRCDATVADYRFAVVEFDEIPKEDQLAFWAAVPLRVVALIDSGGKSIHGWIKIEGVRTTCTKDRSRNWLGWSARTRC